MTTITEVYDKYTIMPTLREHMLRVAAVASVICESIKDFDQTSVVIEACLLHDMGNLIKFRLGYIPELLEPQGLEYWQQAQKEFKEKFGESEHAATIAIARKLNVSERVLAIIDMVGFPNGERNLKENDLGEMIAGYADMRVGPHGVMPLVDRMADLRKRYEDRTNRPREGYEAIVKCFLEIEQRIFEHTSIQPEDITDAAIADRIETLRNATIAA